MITETQAGAERLVADIKAYWKVEGYRPPRLRVRRVPLSRRGDEFEIYEIRSDMRDGRPTAGQR